MALAPNPHTWPQQTQRTDASSALGPIDTSRTHTQLQHCGAAGGGAVASAFFFFFFFFWWKKAYMPIDANHISNPKDR